jgi:hypothetical protein
MEAKLVEVAEMEAEDDAAGVDNTIIKRHSRHSPHLFGLSPEVPLDDGCSADLFTKNVVDDEDGNMADANKKLRAPPAGKLGFKGKRANKKFGHYGKRGGKQKACRTSLLLKTKQVPAIVGLPDYHLLVNDVPNIALAPCSCSSSKCKVNKIQLIQQLGHAAQQLNLETTAKKIALSDVRSITKKLTKSKEVVGQLRECLKDTRAESRSKDKRHSMEVSTLITSVAETTNDLAAKCEAIQNKHEDMLTAVSKKAESKLRGSDRRHNWELSKMTKAMIAKDESHALDLEKKDTEITVSKVYPCD